jgi:general secretion pathway protein H
MITTHGHTPDKSLKTDSDSGFTLIELLVVIVIIGIILSVATLSMGVLGRDNDIEDQAKRLKAVIEQVKEESELQGRDVGLLIEKDGYLFMRYDYATQHWQFMNNDDMTDYRQLPAGLQIRLWLEDREIIVNTHQENQELLSRSSSSSSSSQSSTADIGYQSNMASNTSSSTMKDDVMPQIMILSSGDISPFELSISRDQSDFSWRLIGSDDSTLTLDSGNNLQ